MRQIRMSSTLPISYRPELERIVFFNPEQNQVRVPLVASIRRYGVPEIVESDMCLRFKVRAFGEVQSLFAFDDTEEVPRLAGVVMFTCESTQSMLILHLVIHQNYTYRGANANAGVTAQLLNAVCKLSLHVRGVETLRLLYPHKTQLVLREPRAPSA